MLSVVLESIKHFANALMFAIRGIASHIKRLLGSGLELLPSLAFMNKPRGLCVHSII